MSRTRDIRSADSPPAPPASAPDPQRVALLLRPPLLVGAAALGGARVARGIASLFAGTLLRAINRQSERGAVAEQMFNIGNRSLFFVAVTLGFIALVSVFQVCLQLNRVTGDLSKVGLELIKLMVHESAPSLTAMMLATRVGAGIAAEIGSMVVTEQVDALRMSGVDPVSYLILPRFLACLLMTPVLAVFAFGVALGSGTAMAYVAFGVNPSIFVDFSAVTAADVGIGVVKCFCFGAAIPVVSGYCGLTTFGGSEGVGAATTRAVINASLAVLALDLLLTVAGFMLFPPSAA
ncbi:MAG: ABC transporter permease [Myxococcales bacterium]|nr:ABC transporter permease [Myxococcales bacterium]